MATSTYRNKNLVRPVKRGKAKRQRVSAQRKRLVALGMTDVVVQKLNSLEVRTMLKRPAKVVAKVAKAAARSAQPVTPA